jgi:hypothetical protein
MKFDESQQTFRIKISPPSSGLKSVRSKKPAWSRQQADLCFLLLSRGIPQSLRPNAVIELHIRPQSLLSAFSSFPELYDAVQSEQQRASLNTPRWGSRMNLNKPEHAVGCHGMCVARWGLCEIWIQTLMFYRIDEIKKHAILSPFLPAVYVIMTDNLKILNHKYFLGWPPIYK